MSEKELKDPLGYRVMHWIDKRCKGNQRAVARVVVNVMLGTVFASYMLFMSGVTGLINYLENRWNENNPIIAQGPIHRHEVETNNYENNNDGMLYDKVTTTTQDDYAFILTMRRDERRRCDFPAPNISVVDHPGPTIAEQVHILRSNHDGRVTPKEKALGAAALCK